MPEIIISDQEKLDMVKERIQADGVGKFHVLADFDRTLTKNFVNGEEVSSLISVLRKEGFLTPDYPAKAQGLYDHYHSIEIDPDVQYEEKKKAMEEWWNKHLELLVASRLNMKDVENAVRSQSLQLRDGSENFFGFLEKNNIPLVIISANGLGVESISMYLKNQGLHKNIHIVSNEFIWDEAGFAVEVKRPIIHTLNKDETIIEKFSFYNEVKERKNVLLLGDSPDDVRMIEGFAYDNLIKIGFLNKNIEANIDLYRERYDIVICGDGDMGVVNDLLKEMFEII